jgi:hypothetical protein
MPIFTPEGDKSNNLWKGGETVRQRQHFSDCESFLRKNRGLVKYFVRTYNLPLDDEVLQAAVEAYRRAVTKFQPWRPGRNGKKFDLEHLFGLHFRSLLKQIAFRRERSFSDLVAPLEDESSFEEEIEKFIYKNGFGSGLYEFVNPVEKKEEDEIEEAALREIRNFLATAKGVSFNQILKTIELLRQGVEENVIQKKIKIKRDIIVQIKNTCRKVEEVRISYEGKRI